MHNKYLNSFSIIFIFLFGLGVFKPASCDAQTKRAGIIIIKKYEEGDWAMMLGEKAGSTQEWASVNFPAGQSESKDGADLRNTAVREAIEETGGPHSPLKD